MLKFKYMVAKYFFRVNLLFQTREKKIRKMIHYLQVQVQRNKITAFFQVKWENLSDSEPV